MKIVNKTKTEVYAYGSDVQTKEIPVKEVHLDQGEHRAYSIARLGREMGLNPQETLNEMRENGLSGDEMRAGTRALNMEEKGFEVVGDSSGFKRKPRPKKPPYIPPGTFKNLR